MSQIPTLRQIQYFIAVADTLSFSRAAELCNVTQSTLSAGLNDLELILDEKLFDRSSRNVALTRMGHDLIDPARNLLNGAEEFVHAARRHRAPLSGPLTLGVIPTIAPYLLPRILPKLQKQFPQLELNLREDTTARLLDAMAKNQIDAVLMAFPFDTPGMEQLGLWHEPFFIAQPATHKAPRSKPATLDDLAGQDILLLDDGHCLRDHAMAACRLQSKAQKKTFGATSLPTLIQMVGHGYGLTLLPAMAVDLKNPPPGIVLRPFASPQPTREVGLCWRKNSPRATEFRLLGEFVVKWARGR